MEELFKKLEQRFGEKYSRFKLFDVVYDTLNSVCTICFLYPQNSEDISNEERAEILDFVKEFFALNGEIKIKFKKSFLDEPLVKKEVKNYFEECHKGLTPYINLDNISSKTVELNVEIVIKLNDDILSMLDESAIRQKLIAYLQRKFIASFEVDFQENQTKLPETIEAEDIFVAQKNPTKRYNVDIIKKAIGNDIVPKPEYIFDIKTPKTSVILAGKTSDWAKKAFIIKKGKRKGEEKHFYKFNLKDSTGIMECIYFCGKTNEKIMDSLAENCSQLMLLFVGDVEKGLNDKLCYKIRKISLCSPVEAPKIQEPEEQIDNNIEYIKNKKPVVIPEPIETSSQDSLFGERAKYNDLIMSNEIVVFDLETTGLDPEHCEITEIGAVKIVNGQIKEMFASFVRTQNPIPEEITKFTHITNEMVANAPSLRDVIIDFYNYTRGCIISGYNIIGFDMKFIQKAAAKFGIKFDNQVVDAFIIARQSHIKAGNYKLGSVVKALGLTLVDAHRAYNDAQATAQVLLELSKLKK